MLVLTRSLVDDDHATIVIGDGIEVKLVDIQGGHVRIGVVAPRTIEVNRTEVWHDKQAHGPREANL